MTVTKNHLIFLALYTALVVLITWYFVKPHPVGESGLTQENQQKIDSLNVAIGLLEYRQAEKDSLIVSYKHSIDSLDTQILKTNNKITKIKKDHEKEISNIKLYTVTELDKFFSERYQ